MILYHFTNADHRKILRSRLKAKRTKDYPALPHLPPCVWLTSRANGRFTMGHRKLRLTISVRANDPRLWSWQEWLKNYARPLLTHLKSKAFLREFKKATGGSVQADGWRYWWCYFGDLPVNTIRAVEYGDPKMRQRARKQRTGREV